MLRLIEIERRLMPCPRLAERDGETVDTATERTVQTSASIKHVTERQRLTPTVKGRPGKRHLNVSLTPARLNKLGETGYASPAQVRTLRKLLPGQ